MTRVIATTSSSRRHKLMIGGVVDFALPLVLVAVVLTKDKQESTTAAAEITAANGPLVTDSAMLSSELKCLDAQDNSPWSPVMAAFEVHDSSRTHRYPCASFLGSMNRPNCVFSYGSPQRYITPYNIVDRGPDALFIDGGGYGDNPDASGSFVSRVAHEQAAEDDHRNPCDAGLRRDAVLLDRSWAHHLAAGDRGG